MKTSLLKSFSILACALSVGCAKVESIDVPTEELDMEFSITVEDNEVLVFGHLFSYPTLSGENSVDEPETASDILKILSPISPFITLSDSETLEFEIGQEIKPLLKSDFSDFNDGDLEGGPAGSEEEVAELLNKMVFYSNTYTANEETKATFRFIRASGEIVSQEIDISPAVELTSPLSIDTFSASTEDILFQWNPLIDLYGPENELRMTLYSSTSDCLSYQVSAAFPDSGSFTLEAGKLQLLEGVDECLITVSIRPSESLLYQFGTNPDAEIEVKPRSSYYSFNLIP